MFGWAIDNNLTRRVSSGDPIQIAAAKGLIAGTVNLIIAFAIGAALPGLTTTSEAALLGLLSYGVSLTLFGLALRYIGTARTGAYFSTAPYGLKARRNLAGSERCNSSSRGTSPFDNSQGLFLNQDSTFSAMNR
jgi:hypothetical protein